MVSFSPVNQDENALCEGGIVFLLSPNFTTNPTSESKCYLLIPPGPLFSLQISQVVGCDRCAAVFTGKRALIGESALPIPPPSQIISIGILQHLYSE